MDYQLHCLFSESFASYGFYIRRYYWRLYLLEQLSLQIKSNFYCQITHVKSFISILPPIPTSFRTSLCSLILCVCAFIQNMIFWSSIGILRTFNKLIEVQFCLQTFSLSNYTSPCRPSFKDRLPGH